MTTRDALRALAHPGSVLALVVLALNDHVLKQAYPGLITGKLSDVAGLVVAPLLLAIPLARLRLPRPIVVAIAATGAGFVFAKSSSFGADITSQVWSLSGIETRMRADVTDLLALPALYAAWLVHRSSLAAPRRALRALLATATGVALLPVAVLATAATNCVSEETWGFTSVVEGDFAGPPRATETRVLVKRQASFEVAVDGKGAVTALTSTDRRRYSGNDGFAGQRTCNGAGTCWRKVWDNGNRGSRRVDISTDNGATWRQDFALDDDAVEAAVEGVEPACGADPDLYFVDLSVLGTGDDAVVVVTARAAGIYVRTDGSWRQVSYADLDELPKPPEPRHPPEGRLTGVEPDPPPDTGAPLPTPTPSLPPEPTCEAPVTVSVTPDPRNGRPTTNVHCP